MTNSWNTVIIIYQGGEINLKANNQIAKLGKIARETSPTSINGNIIIDSSLPKCKEIFTPHKERPEQVH